MQALGDISLGFVSTPAGLAYTLRATYDSAQSCPARVPTEVRLARLTGADTLQAVP